MLNKLNKKSFVEMKNIKFTLKLIIDITMLILFILLMGYHLIDESIHEWLGLSVFILFLIHNVLNYRWYKNLFKGKYKITRIYFLIIDFSLLVFMLLNIISAVIISSVIFDPLKIKGNLMIGRQIHLLATMWSFLLVSIHLGLHFQEFMRLIKRIKVSSKISNIIKWTMRIILFVFVIQGINVFIQRKIWEELFLTTQFKFLRYGESFTKFLFDYIALICLFSSCGYYSNKLILLSIKTKKEKNYEN